MAAADFSLRCVLRRRVFLSEVGRDLPR